MRVQCMPNRRIEPLDRGRFERKLTLFRRQKKSFISQSAFSSTRTMHFLSTRHGLNPFDPVLNSGRRIFTTPPSSMRWDTGAALNEARSRHLESLCTRLMPARSCVPRSLLHAFIGYRHLHDPSNTPAICFVDRVLHQDKTRSSRLPMMPREYFTSL